MSTIPPSIPPAHSSRRTLGELLGMDPPGTRDGQAQALPLVRVAARARIVGDCAVTELEEHYANSLTRPMDVRHSIPLPPGGAVVGIEIRAGERVVKGVCRPREDARRVHQEARERGKTSAYIEHVRDDLHEAWLANVPPGAHITVAIRIVERLRVEAGRFEYRLPTALSPKYVPGSPTGHSGEGWSPDTTHAPDASMQTPPMLVGNPVPLEVEVMLAAGATDIQSSVPLTRTDGADGTVSLKSEPDAHCSGDVVVRFWGRGEATSMRAYTDGARTLVVVDPPLGRAPARERIREAVYVIDISGSMSGHRHAAATRALIASLRQLTPRDRVQILAFNDSVARFRPRPTEASPETIEAAIRWIRHLEAKGGTNVPPALEMACLTPVRSGRARTVLLITDGDVANDELILRITRKMDPAARLFVVGVGMAPSATLLSRLARLGGGTYTGIADRDDVEQEILRVEAALGGPIAFGLRCGEDGTPKGDLFAGRATTFFVDGAPDRISVTSIDGEYSGECVAQPSPLPLGSLWARTEVERLEDRRVMHPEESDEIDSRIRQLGVEHQIQTRLTSFVAVDEASQVTGEAVDFVQPVSAPDDVLGERLVRHCMAAPPRTSRENRYCIDQFDSPADAPAPPSRRRSMLAGTTPYWHQIPSRHVAVKLLKELVADRCAPPVLTLLGGKRGLVPALHRCKGWGAIGFMFIAASRNARDLRHALAFIEEEIGIVAGGMPKQYRSLADLMSTLIMLEACAPSQREGESLPAALDGLDTSRGGKTWRRCRATLAAKSGEPGVQDFLDALKARDIPRMIRTAAIAATKAAARASASTRTSRSRTTRQRARR